MGTREGRRRRSGTVLWLARPLLGMCFNCSLEPNALRTDSIRAVDASMRPKDVRRQLPRAAPFSPIDWLQALVSQQSRRSGNGTSNPTSEAIMTLTKKRPDPKGIRVVRTPRPKASEATENLPTHPLLAEGVKTRIKIDGLIFESKGRQFAISSNPTDLSDRSEQRS